MAISREDINTQPFKLVKKGYSPEQVSSFLDMLAGEIANLQDENQRLRDRIETLEKRNVEYAEKENAINHTLIEAGKLRIKIIDEAKAKAEETLSGIEEKQQEMNLAIERLYKEEEQIKARIKYVLEAQLALINQK